MLEEAAARLPSEPAGVDERAHRLRGQEPLAEVPREVVGDRTVDEMGHAWMNVTYLSDEEYQSWAAKHKTR